MNAARLTGPFFLSLLLVVALACTGAQQDQAPTRPAASPAATPAAPSGADRASFEGLSFDVPTGWVSETPSSRMRLAQYRIPAVEGDPDETECGLFHFPGTGGTVQANLDRWYGQFQQPDGSRTSEKAAVETFESDGLPVTLVEVGGTYSGSMGPMGGGGPKTGYRMVAGVVETAEGPWFLKCTGPEATMKTAAPSVRGLLQTVGP